MGGWVSAPYPHFRAKLPKGHNTFLNSGFVYGYASDMLHMVDWCLKAYKAYKYKDRYVYDVRNNRKAYARSYDWEASSALEMEALPLCRDDQVLLCLYADAHVDRVHLDQDEEYVTSIMENQNFDLKKMRTSFGVPSVIHIPFVGRREELYDNIKRKIFSHK